MGTWAEGNFDDDGALDYVGEIIDSLVDRIESILADKKRVALDEEGDAVLMPSVAILGLLSEHCRACPPEPKIIRRWKEKYVEVYDKQIDGVLHEPKSAGSRSY